MTDPVKKVRDAVAARLGVSLNELNAALAANSEPTSPWTQDADGQWSWEHGLLRRMPDGRMVEFHRGPDVDGTPSMPTIHIYEPDPSQQRPGPLNGYKVVHSVERWSLRDATQEQALTAMTDAASKNP
jgi:hypothetical protein